VINVGKLREQTALSPADRRVVLVSKDRELAGRLGQLEIVACYPDTTDEHGNWTGTFKLEVRKREGDGA
jgi:hypothetical protein